MFTKDTTLAEILEFSEAEEILLKNKLPCLSCPMAKYEIQTLTIGQAAGMYGRDIEKILKELNEAWKVYTEKKT